MFVHSREALNAVVVVLVSSANLCGLVKLGLRYAGMEVRGKGASASGPLVLPNTTENPLTCRFPDPSGPAPIATDEILISL